MAEKNPSDVVRSFCSTWATGDIGRLMWFFADDAVYHNIPMAPVTGKDAIKATIEGFSASASKIVFEMKNLAADGNIVFTERDDVFTMEHGTVSLPVAGVFEINGDGKIAAWRDYFDLNQFTSQLPGS